MQYRLLVALIAVFMISCSAPRTIGPQVDVPNVSYSKFVKQYTVKSFADSEIKTAKINSKVSYQIGSSSQKLGLQIRILKGEKIWLSGDFLGIPVVKMMLLRDKVLYYNKIDKTYFEGSYGLIKKLAGVDITFDMIENLLVGDVILDVEKERINFSKTNETYLLRDIDDTFLTEVILYPLVFKCKSQVIEEIIGGSSFEAYYKDYEKVQGFVFPKDLSMKVNNREEAKSSVVTIKYNDVKFNEKISFPYKVPKDCDKEIELKSKETEVSNE